MWRVWRRTFWITTGSDGELLRLGVRVVRCVARFRVIRVFNVEYIVVLAGVCARMNWCFLRSCVGN